MWNSRVAGVRSITFINQCRAPRLSLNNGLTSLNRNLWSGNNSRPNACFNALAARLLRAFDRNLKSMFKIGRCTRNSIFGTFLESRLIQVMLVDFGRTVTRNRDMLLSATCLSVYNWEENSAHDEHIEGFSNDVDFISQLTLETLTCRNCNLRLKIDQKVPDVTYCTCSDSKPSSSEVDGWKPFIERPNTLVWRKEHEAYKGLYAYKSRLIFPFCFELLNSFVKYFSARTLWKRDGNGFPSCPAGYKFQEAVGHIGYRTENYRGKSRSQQGSSLLGNAMAGKKKK